MVTSVKEILARKGTQVWTVGPDATVLQAALLMNEHKIGSLMVTEGGRISGIFTERDVLRRVVGEQRDPARTPVREVMTSELAICTPATSLDEARCAMKDRRIRHLPVVDEQGGLLGVISIGDLNACEAESKDHTIHMLHEYLYGRV